MSVKEATIAGHDPAWGWEPGLISQETAQ